MEERIYNRVKWLLKQPEGQVLLSLRDNKIYVGEYNYPIIVLESETDSLELIEAKIRIKNPSIFVMGFLAALQEMVKDDNEERRKKSKMYSDNMHTI